MYEISSATTYRIMLAVSIALLAHTLLGLFLERYRFPDTTARTVEFQLVRSGEPQTPTRAATPTQAAPVSQAEPRQQHSSRKKAGVAQPEKPKTLPPIISTIAPSETASPTSEHSSRKQTKPVPSSNRTPPASPKPSRTTAEPPVPASSPRKATSPSRPSRSGVHTLQSDTGKQSGVTQLNTHHVKPLSAYERVLWEHIAQRIRFAPFMRNLQARRTVRLQLNLMSNGTLEAVRVIRSSGDAIVDAAARRATLLASPYPPPPAEEAGNGYRFQVELQFAPVETSAATGDDTP